jgi:hypothetical protein
MEDGFVTSVEWVSSDGPKPTMGIGVILLIPYPPSLKIFIQEPILI